MQPAQRPQRTSSKSGWFTGLLDAWKRWLRKLTGSSTFQTDLTHLHLACGDRLAKDWLNVDAENSDYNLDLHQGRLPFESDHFRAIVSENLVTDLHRQESLIPLLSECFRCLELGGELWLSSATRSDFEKENAVKREDLEYSELEQLARESGFTIFDPVSRRDWSRRFPGFPLMEAQEGGNYIRAVK